MDIREQIVSDRIKNISKHGFTQGICIPENRILPLVPFNKEPFLICEVKRKSPSKKNINITMDAVLQTKEYINQGARVISVLTEENHFGGSLNDLARVKNAFPEITVLRKDFLLEIEDIDVSWKAGADAILLIAGILKKEKLINLYNRAKQYGMSVLLEVHSKEDIEKAKACKSEFTGINSRDLSTFKIDMILPLKIKQMITWNTTLVFESGISNTEDAAFVSSSGFGSILVGEAVIKNPGLVPELIKALTAKKSTGFWDKLYKKEKKGRPLIKICGITNTEDALLADSLGADILGFIFAESPRRTASGFIKKLNNLKALKAGIVVLPDGEKNISKEVKNLLDSGLLDVIQFHGNENPENCFYAAFPYYKAVRLENYSSINSISSYKCPRVLVDAYSKENYGGTGLMIDSALVYRVKKTSPLWLAGGLGHDNIKAVLEKYSPELVDASSRLESFPGKKDPDKLKQFFNEIEKVKTGYESI